MTSRGSNETETGRTKRRSIGGSGACPLALVFEWSKVWAGCDGPWPVIFVLVGGFAMKKGYSILRVPDSSPRAFGGIIFISPEA
jgi:hypothetical protein